MNKINVLNACVFSCFITGMLSAASVDPLGKTNKPITETTREERTTALSVSRLPQCLLAIIDEYFYAFEKVGIRVRPILFSITDLEDNESYGETIKLLTPLFCYLDYDKYTNTQQALSKASVLYYEGKRSNEDLGFCQESITAYYFKDGIHIATSKHYIHPIKQSVCDSYTAFFVSIRLTNQNGEQLVLPAGSKISQNFCSNGTRRPSIYNDKGCEQNWKNTPYESGSANCYLNKIEIINLKNLGDQKLAIEPEPKPSDQISNDEIRAMLEKLSQERSARLLCLRNNDDLPKSDNRQVQAISRNTKIQMAICGALMVFFAIKQ